MTTLGPLSGSSDVKGINNLGQVLLQFEVWDSTTGTSKDLLDLGSGAGMSATDINERGQVLGSGCTANLCGVMLWDSKNGRTWSAGDATQDQDWFETAAIAVNDQGLVTAWGASGDVDTASHDTFVWNPSTGQTTILAGLGGTSVVPSFLNNRGQIAGGRQLFTPTQG